MRLGGGIDRQKPIKVLLLGEMAVGKTCVLRRFADGQFISSTRPTVGMVRTPRSHRDDVVMTTLSSPHCGPITAQDLKRTTVDLDGDGSRLTLQIWDTAGQV